MFKRRDYAYSFFLGVSKDNLVRNTVAYFSTAVWCQAFGILCRGEPFPPRQVFLGVVNGLLGGLARLEENQYFVPATVCVCSVPSPPDPILYFSPRST